MKLKPGVTASSIIMLSALASSKAVLLPSPLEGVVDAEEGPIRLLAGASISI